MTSESDSVTLPDSVHGALVAFHKALGEVEEQVAPYVESSSEKDDELSPLERAKLDLMAIYSVNSLYWMYLCTKGENPKEHPVKAELDRLKPYVAQIKEIEDKAKAPKLNQRAAKAFVRNAMFDVTKPKTLDQTETQTQTSGQNREKSGKKLGQSRHTIKLPSKPGVSNEKNETDNNEEPKAKLAKLRHDQKEKRYEEFEMDGPSAEDGELNVGLENNSRKGTDENDVQPRIGKKKRKK